jgi:hypothetical protein
MAEMVGAADRVLVGSVDQIVDLLIERRQRYGFSYIVNWPPLKSSNRSWRAWQGANAGGVKWLLGLYLYSGWRDGYSQAT